MGARLVLLSLGFSLASCAPAYIPGTANVGLLQARKDLSLSGQLGSNGAQVNAAYAVADRWALRGTAQTSLGGGGNFQRAGLVGLGRFWAATPESEGEFPTGYRAGTSLDLGAAVSRGSATVNFGSSSSTVTYSGPSLRAALQGDIAYEWQYFAAGAAGRLSFMHLWHDAQSNRAGEQANALFAEPLLFLRAGARSVKVELQAGLTLPVAVDGAVGVPLPLILAAGLVGDF